MAPVRYRDRSFSIFTSPLLPLSHYLSVTHTKPITLSPSHSSPLTRNPRGERRERPRNQLAIPIPVAKDRTNALRFFLIFFFFYFFLFSARVLLLRTRLVIQFPPPHHPVYIPIYYYSLLRKHTT